MKTMQYLKGVATLKLESALCTGCGMCINVCPHEVFKIQNKKVQIVNIDNCMECGACALNCERGAISVRSGVGCAAGILNGILNNTEPSCDCSTTKEKECC